MASIRSLHSPDIHDSPSWTPPDPRDVGLLLQILPGPADSPGEESFDLVTLRWLEVRSPTAARSSLSTLSCSGGSSMQPPRLVEFGEETACIDFDAEIDLLTRYCAG